MDSDVTTLDNALAVLQRYYGKRLDGSRERTEAQMRHTLRQQMGMDEATAAHVLQQLTVMGRLVYVGGAPGGPLPVAGSTGPVISMPLTQSADGGKPLITAASPSLVMGVVDDAGGDVGEIVDSDVEGAPEPGISGEVDGGNGYWRIG
jgi:hypothetical protein